MKPVRKCLVFGVLVSILTIGVLSSYYIIDDSQLFGAQKVTTIQYRVSSTEANLNAVVDYKAGRESLSTQKVKLPWVSEVKKVLRKGEPIALYFSTYNEVPTSLTCEIWVDGKKIACQTDNSQDFISNNISCRY